MPQLRERIAARMHLAPALARRLDADRAQPSWVPDPSFDIANHVVEHRHHDPVDSDGLHVCVARLFEQRLNRERPLWQMDVIELERGQRALVWRIHHALADGTAAVRYARALLWDDGSRAIVGAQPGDRPARRRRRASSGPPGRVRCGGSCRRSRAASPFDGADRHQSRGGLRGGVAERAAPRRPGDRRRHAQRRGADRSSPGHCATGCRPTTATSGHCGSRCRSACTTRVTPRPTTTPPSRSPCRSERPTPWPGCA